MNRRRLGALALLAMALVLAACGAQPPAAALVASAQESGAQATADAAPAHTVRFTLQTTTSDDHWAYKGVGGEIDGMLNPVLRVPQGAEVEITLINGDGKWHRFTVDGYEATTSRLTHQGSRETISFIADRAGTFEYRCAEPLHQQLGMAGRLVVEGEGEEQPARAADAPAPAAAPSEASAAATVRYTLETTMDGGMAFKGVGGEIDGAINPELVVPAGARVELTLVNGDGMQHDLTIDALGVKVPAVTKKGERQTVTFTASQNGTFEYYCSVPGHKQAGMAGRIVVEGGDAAPSGGAPAHASAAAQPGDGAAPAADASHPPAVEGAPVISADPNAVPAPVGPRAPQTVKVDLETVEVDGQLADGTTYRYWTFNGTVPGPMIRVRAGDTVEIALKNSPESAFAHSIDLHAVTGHHGGGSLTQAAPGETRVFTFKALNPGVYVYHCATPMVPHHIANGMYGLIVVEPEGGLPPVDREFYVMQGEIYSTGKPGDTGHLDFNVDAMLDEKPNYLVFNGSTVALTEDLALRAKAGETVRIYMGVGGPNLTSSFHVIGEIFDRVYDLASITAPPLTDVQTVLVPPGGATVVEFTVEEPGTYVLVDHALGRLVKGLKAYLIVEGEPNPEIIHEGPAS